MIEITALLKTYRSKKKKVYTALDNVDLTLPDHGLVFLLGKSGSGKSTFLNLLGGLDRATSGHIAVDGNDLSAYTKGQLDDYRSSCVGFIFQDYCLIDELTVYDNIAAVLTIQGLRDDRKVEEVLKTVGLAGHGDKYPAELSGGERQRVAVARAIIKNPRIILADEPTGNLDGEATETVFDLLKTISQDSLVFVVSHDNASAQKYADRIIVLESGRIRSDGQKLPGCNPIPKPETQKADHFSKDTQKTRHMRSNRLGWLFLKSKLFRITLSAFIAALIMVVMMLAQTICAFDAADVIKNELIASSPDSVFLTKTLDQAQKEQAEQLGKIANSFVPICDADITAFRDAGYTGNIYPVYKCNINISQSQISAGMATNIFEESPYILEPLGIMVVSEDFITEKYGKFQYAAKAEQFHPTGVIITDYLADIMLQSGRIPNAADYDDLLGTYHWGSNDASRRVARGYINGIIDTGYKEKYHRIFEAVEKYGSDFAENAFANNDFLRLADDIHTMYGFCYSLNPNFAQDALDNPSWDMVWHYALRFGDGQIFTTDIPQVRKASSYAIALGEDEVLMEMTAYNKIFHTQYTAETLPEFNPHTETLHHYLYAGLTEEDAQFTRDIRIAGLFVADQTELSGTFLAGDGVYDLFAQSHIYTTGLYFDHCDHIPTVADTAAEFGFQSNLIVAESVRTMTRIVDIFVPVFRIMAVILCVAIVFILINFASKMITDKMKEIGILKANGMKNRAVSAIFGVQILLICLLTAVLSAFGYSLFVEKANDLLIQSLRMIASGKMIPDLTFLAFRFDIVVQNCILIFLLAFIAYIVPAIRIRILDPAKIIRDNE